MNNFVKGLLVGVGIGLLVAPMRGEETRQLISERASQLRGYLPENEQLEMYRNQVADRVRDTASTLKDYAQQAATSVKSGASNLSEIGQNATSDASSTVKRTSKDVANTADDAYNATRSNLRS